MRLLDSHVHFWDPRHLTYPWLAEVPPLNRAFTPEDLAAQRPEPVDVVFVEAGRAAHQAGAEIDRVRRAARHRPWIRGAVAHAELEDPARARPVIRAYAGDPFVVGVRRNVQDEAAGLHRRPPASAPACASSATPGCPSTPACARTSCRSSPNWRRPARRPRSSSTTSASQSPPGDTSWRQALRRLARHGNVVCKLSGLATEAAPAPRVRIVAATLREALQVFGPGRCLYGSDWPVMTLATDYGSWLDLVRAALAAHAPEAADAVLYGNAARIYQVDRATPLVPNGT